MNLGETATVTVQARLPWNLTGIQIKAGERYSMRATGEWVDWYIHHGPEGDPSGNLYLKLLEPFRRMKIENWFALIGALDSKIATAFRIGAGCDFEAQSDGQLTCFANDIEGFYFNNYGSVTLTVTRISADSDGVVAPRGASSRAMAWLATLREAASTIRTRSSTPRGVLR